MYDPVDICTPNPNKVFRYNGLGGTRADGRVYVGLLAQEVCVPCTVYRVPCTRVYVALTAQEVPPAL